MRAGLPAGGTAHVPVGGIAIRENALRNAPQPHRTRHAILPWNRRPRADRGRRALGNGTESNHERERAHSADAPDREGRLSGQVGSGATSPTY